MKRGVQEKDPLTPPPPLDTLDTLVLASLLQHWQDLSFLTSEISYLSVSGGIYDFYGRLHSGVGRPHGGFPDFGYLDPSGLQAPYQLLGTPGGRGRLSSLGLSASGPPGHDS